MAPSNPNRRMSELGTFLTVLVAERKIDILQLAALTGLPQSWLRYAIAGELVLDEVAKTHVNALAAGIYPDRNVNKARQEICRRSSLSYDVLWDTDISTAVEKLLSEDVPNRQRWDMLFSKQEIPWPPTHARPRTPPRPGTLAEMLDDLRRRNLEEAEALRREGLDVTYQ